MINWAAVAAVIPVLLSIGSWYVISKPWFCSGMCCMSEASCQKVVVGGTIHPKFKGVASALERSLTQGWDIGASVYAAVDDEVILDVAGGYKDKAKTLPYTGDTVNVVFSSGKVIETIGMAILVDRGLVELDAPIAEYWPEFSQKGKGEVTLKDMLSHRSGSMTLFEEVPSVNTLQDPELRDKFLASQAFLYPRGTVGYRAWGSALYSDAICRRVDPNKRSLYQLVQEELFHPLDEDFFCPPVTGASFEARFSDVHDIPLPTMLLGLLPQALFLPRSFYRSVLGESHRLLLQPTERDLFQMAILQNEPFGKPSIPHVDWGAASYNNRSSYLSYEMMSANCISNARGLGGALGAFMGGEVVKEDTLASFLNPFPTSFDILLRHNGTYLAGGFGKKDGLFRFKKDNADCSGWGGIGGSTIQYCSVGEHSVTFSYVMNGMSPRIHEDRAASLFEGIMMSWNRKQFCKG